MHLKTELPKRSKLSNFLLTIGTEQSFSQLNIQSVVYHNWEVLDSLSSPHLAGFKIGTKLFVASPLDKQAGVPLNCPKSHKLEAFLGCAE